MADVKDIANCFLFLDDQNQSQGMSNLKLQKLVYYAQGYFSALFDKPLFDAEIMAWQHGPVVPELYHAYKHYGRNPIAVAADFDIDKLAKDELELINEVYDVFGPFEAWKLRDMTHEETPWMDHEKTADAIPLEEIKAYFKTRI